MKKVKFNFRCGQVAIYLIMILVVVFMLALMNVDSFISIRGKNRVQNAGDAAALAASRKQGTLINEIGRLNLEHIIAAVENNTNRCVEIERLQRRLALLGPIDALDLANDAAKKNGMVERDEFVKILRDHLNIIRTVYISGENAQGEPYPESYPGAWNDYAVAIENVISGGLAVGPDNMEFYDALHGHRLLDHGFYQAIAGRDWCWFHFNDMPLLTDYQSYHDWGSLPSTNQNSCVNSEIFSLHMTAKEMPLKKFFSKDEIKELVKSYANIELTDEEFDSNNLLSDPMQVWFFYDYRWGKWFDGLRLSGDEDNYEFPLVGEVLEEYNVRGCAAVCRCYKEVESFALERISDLTWAAAAKPFGVVNTRDSEVAKVTYYKNFVIPSFSDVRLVALDTVGGEDLSTADYYWITHIRYHLIPYLLKGPQLGSSCFYCQQLQTWERESFRSMGVIWLKHNSGTCVRPTGGSHGAGGGTSHGH